MKDIDDMTIKEAIDEFSQMLLDFGGDEFDMDRFSSLYCKITCDMWISTETENFVTYVYIGDKRTDEFIHKIVINAVSGELFERWQIHHSSFSDELWTAKKWGYSHYLNVQFATEGLEHFTEELNDENLQRAFKGHHVVDFGYLLANSHKDVIEWALKHKDELGVEDKHVYFAIEFQGVPELKEMILDELSVLRKKKGGKNAKLV